MRQKAISLWNTHSQSCFDREESLCLMHGFVHASAELYVMAMPYHSSMSMQDLYGNRHLYHPTCHPCHLSKADSLHIVMAVGSMQRFAALYRATPSLQRYRFFGFHRWQGSFQLVTPDHIFRFYEKRS